MQVQVFISETNEQGLRDMGNNLEFKRFFRGKEMSSSLQQVQSRVFDPLSGNFFGPTLPMPVASAPDNFKPALRPDNDSNPRTSTPVPSGFGINSTILNSDVGTLESTFRALENRGDLDLISQPEILVNSGAAATIKSGTRLPYQSIIGQTTVSNLMIEWKDTGVNMVITPTVLGDAIGIMFTELNVSDTLKPVQSRGLELPSFSKRSQTGEVVVPNGQTLVVGGLSSRSIISSEQRIPLLGDLPVVGVPFRKRLSKAKITTLLIFVRPTIVDLRALSKEGASAMEFWKERGNSWTNKDRIESEIKRMGEGF